MGINDTEFVRTPQQNTTVPTYFASLHFQIVVTASGKSKSQLSTEVQAGIKPKMFAWEYGHGQGLGGSANDVVLRMGAEHPG